MFNDEYPTPAALVAELVAKLNAMNPTPDPMVLDINTQQPPGLNAPSFASAPMTNQQASMVQNEATLRYLKSKKR